MDKLSPAQYTVLIAIICSIGGLLFGYDTAVISGAVSYFSEHFSLSPAMVGWGVSSALVGCIIGAYTSSFISSRYGRRKTLALSAFLFALSAIGSAYPETFSQLVLFRIVGGLGMGLASMVVPVYLSEISPTSKRGIFGTFYQIMITFGILCTYLINFVIVQGATHEWLVNDGWRYMFLGEVVPAILLLVASFFIPESPRWLVMRGDEKQAKKILLNINGESEAKDVFLEIKADIAISHDSREGIFKSGLGKILFIAVALAMLSQATGINVIIYYATVLLNSIGTSDGGPSIWSSVFFQNVLIGVTVFVSAFFPIFTVERWGRRPLMIWGSLGVAVTIITVGLALFFGQTGIWLLAVLLVYLAIFGATLGPLPWILMSEICPNSHRNKIVAISTLLFWFANVIVAQTFPMMNDSVMLKEIFKGSFPFFVYGGFSLALAYVCHRYLPETKGKSIEQVYQNLLPGKIS